MTGVRPSSIPLLAVMKKSLKMNNWEETFVNEDR